MLNAFHANGTNGERLADEIHVEKVYHPLDILQNGKETCTIGDTCNPYISFAMGAPSPNPKAFNPANAVTGPIHSELLP